MYVFRIFTTAFLLCQFTLFRESVPPVQHCCRISITAYLYLQILYLFQDFHNSLFLPESLVEYEALRSSLNLRRKVLLCSSIQVLILTYLKLSQWPIKSQHKLFSPQKVHVRMHESLMYEICFNGRVSSPSTSNNIIYPGWGEYAVDNYGRISLLNGTVGRYIYINL